MIISKIITEEKKMRNNSEEKQFQVGEERICWVQTVWEEEIEAIENIYG